MWVNIEIKLVKTETGSNYLVSEPNCQNHTTTFFSGNLISHGNEKTQILINKSIYLGPSILELSKIVIYEFWYDYMKPKYGEKSILCYMDTGSLIVYIKTE